MTNPLRHIRYAGVEEAAIAVEIWREAAAWAKASGHPYWRDDTLRLEIAEAHRRAGELVLGFGDNAACACMLLQTSDPMFWLEKQDDPALYVHRLAVKRASAGKGWGSALLAWAAGRAADIGVPLRLDCAPRPRLMNLYTTNGFVAVDAGPVERGGFTVMRYERR